jgi:glycosyltransferase involved in cell wall biosynthesis
MIEYPKVLVIGETFHTKSGGGITISNLFKGWPKDKLAVATDRINESELSTCEIYYRIGFEENKQPWPFYKIQTKENSGLVDINELLEINKLKELKGYKNVVSPSKFHPSFKSFFVKFLQLFGLINYVYRLRLSKSFEKWIINYNPDILYVQTNRYSIIKFVNSIYSKLKIPFVVHIMDDYIITMNKPGILYFYYKKKIDSEFRNLIQNAGCSMSISPAMSEEYYKRYGKLFIPFRNPVEIEKWLPYSKTNWEVSEEFKLLYAGRMVPPNSAALEDIINAVLAIRKEGYKVCLNIYTLDTGTELEDRIKSFDGIDVKPPVNHDKMPALLAKHDLLILPLDFNKSGIKYAQFSVSTKTSEYMISGVPVLVYADSQTALYKYANKDNWGYTVNERSIFKLTKAIKVLYQNKALRENLGKKGIEIAKRDGDADNERNKFRNYLLSSSKMNQKEVLV